MSVYLGYIRNTEYHKCPNKYPIFFLKRGHHHHEEANIILCWNFYRPPERGGIYKLTVGLLFVLEI